jgi:hypothetical protein
VLSSFLQASYASSKGAPKSSVFHQTRKSQRQAIAKTTGGQQKANPEMGLDQDNIPFVRKSHHV